MMCFFHASLMCWSFLLRFLQVISLAQLVWFSLCLVEFEDIVHLCWFRKGHSFSFANGYYVWLGKDACIICFLFYVIWITMATTTTTITDYYYYCYLFVRWMLRFRGHVPGTVPRMLYDINSVNALRIVRSSLLSAYFKPRPVRWTFMKVGVDIMPVEATPNSYFFLQSVIPTWWMHELVWWQRHWSRLV